MITTTTNNIVKFLRAHYSDAQLAALLAHAEDGKLAYDSCCCLVGIPTAMHALKPARPKHFTGWDDGSDPIHNITGRCWEFGKEAENEFRMLGRDDAERRERLIPIIVAEIERRDRKQESAICNHSSEMVKGIS